MLLNVTPCKAVFTSSASYLSACGESTPHTNVSLSGTSFDVHEKKNYHAETQPTVKGTYWWNCKEMLLISRKFRERISMAYPKSVLPHTQHSVKSNKVEIIKR